MEMPLATRRHRGTAARRVQQVTRDIPLVLVVGPTAVGKTALAITLAEMLGGEIVSADSRQIYRGMDIGTAKASPEDRARVPHHLLDVVDPDQALGLAEYQARAYAAVEAIAARSRLALLVGGTGQYVRAVAEGWRIPAVAPQHDLRQALEQEAAEKGPQALHARLAAVDPVAAARIDYRNVRRVVRALEVVLVSGHPISQQQQKQPPPYRMTWLGITRPRPSLYARVDARVDRMVADGLVEEVRWLHEQGYAWDLPAMSGLGYRQIGAYLRGECGLEQALALVRRATRRFVQQQYNWFPPDDPAIWWLDPDHTSASEIVNRIRDWLGN